MSAIEHDSDRVLQAFRRTALDMPWYRTLLDEHGVQAADITNLAAFSNRCPVLSRRNTFDRFPLHELAHTHRIAALAGVLTSSGHGGRFSFGLTTRRDAEASGQFIDRALDAAFDVGSRPTLAINCLPMGVGFSSQCMTVATTSVREDMAVALAQAFGAYYDQILLVADPLFMKRLTDYAAAHGMDWSRHRVQVVLGEEVFGERFRDYVGSCLGLRVDRPHDGCIISSFGVGELGLHLCYETPATIALRRLACSRADVSREILGLEQTDGAVPMIFTYEPRRTFIEAADADAGGYGRMTVSMLDPELPIPLLRYQTGDIVKILDREAVAAAMRRLGLTPSFELPSPLLALQGREQERLPNGSHVGAYKDALYADHVVARSVTGALRMIFSGEECTMHVQLAEGMADDDRLSSRLIEVLPERARPVRLHFWPYHRFPFGMTVDYERKFRHYVPGEQDVVLERDQRARRE